MEGYNDGEPVNGTEDPRPRPRSPKTGSSSYPRPLSPTSITSIITSSSSTPTGPEPQPAAGWRQLKALLAAGLAQGQRGYSREAGAHITGADSWNPNYGSSTGSDR
ncbi:unnamed protein product [Boreogadus saida]